jgi:hypothetical protein
MSDVTNEDRAAWAAAAAEEFAQATFYRSLESMIVDLAEGDRESSDLRCCLQDLITDTLHLAKQHGLDVEKLHEHAYGNYVEELEEELEEDP